MGKHIIWVPLAILATLLAVLLWLGFQAHPQDTPESSPETTAALQEDQAAPPDPTDWRLMLVNPWNAIPQGYQPELVTVENGYQVDQRCANDLSAMLADCRAAGYRPAICSAYRTQEKQAALYDTLVRKRMAQGLSQTEAQKQAATEVAVPGTSEHQLGLAVDLVDASYQVLDEAQASTPAQQWLMEHCWGMGSSCVTPPRSRTSPASSMSRGITGTWAGTMPRPSGSPANAWKSSSRPSTPEQHKASRPKVWRPCGLIPARFPRQRAKRVISVG